MKVPSIINGKSLFFCLLFSCCQVQGSQCESSNLGHATERLMVPAKCTSLVGFLSCRPEEEEDILVQLQDKDKLFACLHQCLLSWDDWRNRTRRKIPLFYQEKIFLLLSTCIGKITCPYLDCSILCSLLNISPENPLVNLLRRMCGLDQVLRKMDPSERVLRIPRIQRELCGILQDIDALSRRRNGSGVVLSCFIVPFFTLYNLQAKEEYKIDVNSFAFRREIDTEYSRKRVCKKFMAGMGKGEGFSYLHLEAATVRKHFKHIFRIVVIDKTLRRYFAHLPKDDTGDYDLAEDIEKSIVVSCLQNYRKDDDYCPAEILKGLRIKPKSLLLKHILDKHDVSDPFWLNRTTYLLAYFGQDPRIKHRVNACYEAAKRKIAFDRLFDRYQAEQENILSELRLIRDCVMYQKHFKAIKTTRRTLLIYGFIREALGLGPDQYANLWGLVVEKFIFQGREKERKLEHIEDFHLFKAVAEKQETQGKKGTDTDSRETEKGDLYAMLPPEVRKLVCSYNAGTIRAKTVSLSDVKNFCATSLNTPKNRKEGIKNIVLYYPVPFRDLAPSKRMSPITYAGIWLAAVTEEMTAMWKHLHASQERQRVQKSTFYQSPSVENKKNKDGIPYPKSFLATPCPVQDKKDPTLPSTNALMVKMRRPFGWIDHSIRIYLLFIDRSPFPKIAKNEQEYNSYRAAHEWQVHRSVQAFFSSTNDIDERTLLLKPCCDDLNASTDKFFAHFYDNPNHVRDVCKYEHCTILLDNGLGVRIPKRIRYIDRLDFDRAYSYYEVIALQEETDSAEQV